MFDKNDIPTGPVKPAAAPTPGSFSAEDIPKQSTPSGKLPGAPTGINFDEFRFQPKVSVDNYLLRAQDQGFGEQLVKTVGNSAANIVTGLAEGFGYLPELLDSSHDYSNALTRKMQEWKNPFGEVYRENPNETFDLGDPAWWLGNVQTLVESAGAFAVEGIGLAKIFGGLAKGASTLVNAGKIGSRVARGAAEVATASTMAYTEGAMSGYRTYETAYKENYDKAIQNGHTPDEARTAAAKIASNAAAKVVRLNTMMNTVLNIGELAPFFHEPTDDIIKWFKTDGARQAGETRKAWKSRLMSAAEQNPELKSILKNRGHKGFSTLAAESVKEGVEEVNTQYAEHEGQRVADGQDRNIFEALTDIGQYFSDVTNQEGALNFILGSIGGVAQTLLVDNVPARSVVRYDDSGKPVLKTNAAGEVIYDKNGKPKYQKQLVSGRTRNAFGANKFFEGIRDAIVSDIDYMDRKHEELIKAKAVGNQADMARIRGEIFSVGALDAVRKGLGDNWISQYEEIAALENDKSVGELMQPQIDAAYQQVQEARAAGDEKAFNEANDNFKKLHAQQLQLQDITPAMQQGFATNKNDDTYKERARQAVEDLKHLKEVHEAIQKKWADDTNPATAELADHLFFRTADLYLRKRAIEREEARIQKLEQLQGNLASLNPTLVDNSIDKYNTHIHTLNETLRSLQADIDAIKAADKKGDVKTLQSMIEKYRAKGLHDSDMAGAINDLVRTIGLKAKQYEVAAKAARDDMEAGSGFTEWKKDNADKSFDDYTATVGQNVMLQNDKANLEAAKVQHQIAEQNLQEMTAGKGIDRMLKAFAEQKDKAAKAIDERNKKDNVEDFLRLQTKKAAARMTAKQKQALAEQLNTQKEQLQQQLDTTQKKLNELEAELKEKAKGLPVFRNIDKLVTLRSAISRQKGIVRSLQAQLKTIENQLDLIGVQAQKAEAKVVKAEATTVDEINETEELADESIPTEPEEEFDPLSPAQESNHNLQDLMAKEEEMQSSDPMGTYLELRKTLPPVVLPILDKLEQEYKGKEPSYQGFVNAFRQPVHLEIMDQGQVTDAFFKFRDYINELAKPQPNLVPKAEEAKTKVPVAEQELVPADDIPLDFEVGGQPVIQIEDAIFSEQGLHDMAWEDSAKTVDAVKANSADLKYIPVVYNGRVMLRNQTINGAPQLDDTSNTDRMLPGRIAVGDEVELQIDTNWDGKINNDHQLEQDENLQEEKTEDRYENYIDQNGKIRTAEHEATVGYGNVPIKIVHKETGKVIGYFPRVDWITATQGAQGFRNVADEVPVKGSDEKMSGNNAIQMQINLAIRRKLAQLHNERPGATLKTTVSGRTSGRVLYHGDLNDSTGRIKYKTKLAKSLLPDKGLRYGVMTKTGPITEKGTEIVTNMKLVPMSEAQRKRMAGAPVVFLPLPNGEYKVVPLLSTRFEDRQADLRTVERVIELYLQHGTQHITDSGHKIIDKILDKTGFDITTEEGLRNFITQYYTYTSNFEDSQVAADAPARANGKRVIKFMLAIPGRGTAKKAPIKVGVSYSGQNVVYASLKNGKLDPVFAASLRAGIGKRFKNVTLSDGKLNGVNEDREITTITINKNDVASAKTYKTYNDYLRDNLYTSVHGLTKVGDTYVYAANSQVILNKDLLMKDQKNARELVVETNPLSAGTIIESQEEDEDAIDYISLDQRVPEYVKHVIKPAGTPLNLANLQEIYRFTEDSARNGKTPSDVLDYLTGLGISALADGYNPFQKCS